MRQTMIGLAAAAAVMTMSAPAFACGGLFTSGCSPCVTYVSPCAQPTYSYGYGGYDYGYGGYGVAAYEMLPEPTTQYFYANQGPVYSGPGNFAPAPVYREATVSYAPSYGYGYGYRQAYRPWRGYAAPRYGYAPMRHHWRHHMHHHHRHHGARYGYSTPRYGYARGPGYSYHRQPVLRRYN